MAFLEHLKVAEREHKADKGESESEPVVLRESGLFPILGGSIADAYGRVQAWNAHRSKHWIPSAWVPLAT